MKSKTVILLSVLIAVMLCIIAAATSYLYSSPQEKPAPVLADGASAPLTSNTSEVKTGAENTAGKDAEETSGDKKNPGAPVPADTKAAEGTSQNKDGVKTEAGKTEFKVKNSGTGRMNTLRQLEDNSLVLIDHNGKQLWKIAFPGKIVGEPAQIDIYSNMKIQYLIAEGSSLHLIDRLGREVKKFPLALPGAAKSGPKDVRSGQIVYWQIETAAGTVWFDKQKVTVLNQKP